MSSVKARTNKSQPGASAASVPRLTLVPNTPWLKERQLAHELGIARRNLCDAAQLENDLLGAFHDALLEQRRLDNVEDTHAEGFRRMLRSGRLRNTYLRHLKMAEDSFLCAVEIFQEVLASRIAAGKGRMGLI